MTQRRRFFPSTPVQTVPGRTVEIEVQVRRIAPAPAPEVPVVEPPVCPVPVIEPPVWYGWEDDDGNRLSEETAKPNVPGRLLFVYPAGTKADVRTPKGVETIPTDRIWYE